MSLRDLFVGITFNDKASKQIDRVDKSRIVQQMEQVN